MYRPNGGAADLEGVGGCRYEDEYEKDKGRLSHQWHPDGCVPKETIRLAGAVLTMEKAKIASRDERRRNYRSNALEREQKLNEMVQQLYAKKEAAQTALKALNEAQALQQPADDWVLVESETDGVGDDGEWVMESEGLWMSPVLETCS